MSRNPSSPEGRQHISLSNYAYSVVRNDSLTYMGKINNSGFINRIVTNSMLYSFEEISHIENERISNELINYSKNNRRIRLTDSDQDAIKRISDAHRNYLIKSFTQYPKDVVLKIRLNNELHDCFYNCEDWIGHQYNISQGDYIKYLIEEYARKTIFDRESILFKTEIIYLDTLLGSDETKRIQITLIDGSRYILKPYRLSHDYEADYHYIIGMSTIDGKNDFIPASFRISRIARIQPRSLSSGSGKITKKEKQDIERKIKESGISYILGEPVEHIINLSSVGMNMYNTIFHQRPIYDNINKNNDGSFTLTINATTRQVTNYFFVFGQEAEIISPEETHDWMRDRYKAAYNSYKQ